MLARPRRTQDPHTAPISGRDARATRSKSVGSARPQSRERADRKHAETTGARAACRIKIIGTDQAALQHSGTGTNNGRNL